MNTNNIFNQELKEWFNFIIKSKKLSITVEPSEPPLIKVINGKHTNLIKLGKFLKSNTNFDDAAIKNAVEQYKEINGNLDQYKVKFQTNYAEVYETPLYAIDSTNRSCMTGESCVEVYDYDDRLALLCIYKNKALVGRTLVRYDTKTYIRLYIDHNNLKPHIFKAIIAKEGFNNQGSLSGIKLRYIEKYDSIVCPYLDGGTQNLYLVDHEYLLIDSDGDLCGDNTDGVISNNNHNCDNCGCSVHEDYIYFVNDESLCDECLNENYVYIDSVGDYVSKDDCVLCKSNDEYYKSDDDDLCCVDSEDAYYLLDDVVSVNDTWELLENTVELVEEYNYNNHALTEDCIEVNDQNDWNHLEQGYYLREQLEEIIETIEEELERYQEDLFEDVKAKLNEELEHIRELIG